MRVIVVGCGVAGAETGTYLGQKTQVPLEIIEIESEPQRKFGGWGFQSFPGESTNLAMRKMYLGEGPENLYAWASSVGLEVRPDEPFPRAMMQEYVKWRRGTVNNARVSYNPIVGEAVKVELAGSVRVKLKDGPWIEGDRLVMASGSISVKIPEYLNPFLDDERVIVDPLTKEGHERRSQISPHDSVLVLGTGLTGEEQVNVLLKTFEHMECITLFSRGGKRHYSYPKEQSNKPLNLDEPPEFLHAETPEEFTAQLGNFFTQYLVEGHTPEDLFAAIRPHWDQMRAELGGCHKAAERIRQFRRELAVSSIGCPWEVGKNLCIAEEEGKLRVINGSIKKVEDAGPQFQVWFDNGICSGFHWIINAVGRNIIRHSIWEQLLEDGIAKKHAGIGVRVSETGRMVAKDDSESDRIWVVGMARAGDHALRHGFLGNTAFNVPMVRSHLYDTMDDLLTTV